MRSPVSTIPPLVEEQVSERVGSTYMLTLEYDGAGFSGWQRQPGRRTVEGTLQLAINQVTGETPGLTASGRTDAGAHAHGQVAGCTLRSAWDCERLRTALNARLPEDVCVIALEQAPPGFHARFDAIARTYRYVVAPRPRRAVGRQYAWFVEGDVDLEAMRRGAHQLVGTHDFGAFGRSPRPGGTTVRTVHDVDVRLLPMAAVRVLEAVAAPAPAHGVVVIDVTADAFLHGMMRGLAGALVDVGRGRLEPVELGAMLGEGRRRPRAPRHAPAHGLHQWRVIYPSAGTAPPAGEFLP
jgi:tRNA pseudouridine38-40 synthase